MTETLGELSRVRGAFETPTLRLLHQEHAPVVVAILRTAFPREAATIPAIRLHAHVEHFLTDLRAEGESGVPAGAARELCLRWTHGQWLVRSQDTDGTETFALTSHAQDALNLVFGLTRERVALSEHRIATIVDAVRRFNAAANPSRAARISVLNSQIRDLEASRDALERGESLPQMTADSMADGYGEVLALVSGLPSDFARVQESYSRLRSDILEAFRAESRPAGQVIDEYLEKVDNLTTATPEGRAFQGAFALLRDEALLLQLREDIDALLAHPMAAEILIATDRRDLRSTVNVIDQGMSGVLAQRRRVTATLRDYITTHNAARDRELDATLRHLEAALAGWFATTGPRASVDLPLIPGQLTVEHLRGRFHDPREVTAPPPLQDVTADQDPPATLAELRAHGGPSMDALTALLADALTRPATPGSLGELFAELPTDLRRPVEILGLLQIATQEDFTVTADTEPYATFRPDGTTRTFEVPQVTIRTETP